MKNEEYKDLFTHCEDVDWSINKIASYMYNYFNKSDFGSLNLGNGTYKQSAVKFINKYKTNKL